LHGFQNPDNLNRGDSCVFSSLIELLANDEANLDVERRRAQLKWQDGKIKRLFATSFEYIFSLI
jgi:hypothetical protein